MEVKLYTYAKRSNSTIQPGGGLGTVYEGELKQGTSVLSPVIKFRFNAGVQPSLYNYAYISTFHRYYYINDWVWQDGLWFASLNVDALASWKSEIGLQSLYVTRSASQATPDLPDLFYPTENPDNGYIVTTPIERIWSAYGRDAGLYVVGIITSSQYATGSVNYYAMNTAQMRTFTSYLMSEDFFAHVKSVETSISELPDLAIKLLFEPFVYIVSCNWFPIDWSQVIPYDQTQLSRISVGWWMLPDSIKAYVIKSDNERVIIDGETTLPTHPQANQYRAFLNGQGFTKYVLNMPPFGNFEIDPMAVYKSHALYFQLGVSLVSGQGFLYVFNGAKNSPIRSVIASLNCTIAVPVQISAITRKNPDMVAGIISSVAGMLQGTDVSGFGGIGKAIYNPNLQTLGTNADIMQYQIVPSVTSYFTQITEQNNAEFGRPLCKTRTINTLAGFVKVESADINIDCTQFENSIIKDNMQKGFFFE